MTAPRWVNRPDGSNWGDFGPDDQLGRLNLITPDKVLAGVREVREGLAFCLSLPLDAPAGARAERFPPRLFPTGENCRHFHWPLSNIFPGATGVSCDDAAEICLQFSTQWDSLAHAGARFDADGDGVDEVVYYNGWRAGEHILDHQQAKALGKPSGAHRLGIETYAEKAIQTRGVMLDFERAFGTELRPVRFAEFAHLLEGVDIAPGDIVCINTGVSRAIMAADGAPDQAAIRQVGPALDGSDPEVRSWITRSGISALVADNFAVEFLQPVDPAKPGSVLPIHDLCLFHLGVPLGELWLLADLADALAERDRRHFLLTAPPLRLPRAVGSPANPIATI